MRLYFIRHNVSKKTNFEDNQGLISSAFYKELFFIKMLFGAFLYLEFVFVFSVILGYNELTVGYNEQLQGLVFVYHLLSMKIHADNVLKCSESLL